MNIDSEMISEPLHEWLGQTDAKLGGVVGVRKRVGEAVRMIGKQTAKKRSFHGKIYGSPASLELFFAKL